jgi:hypothetical protein
VGKPNERRERERERERFYYSASGKYISTSNSQFPAKEKYLTAPKLSPTISALKFVPNPYSCTTLSKTVPRKPCQQVCCMA